MAGIRSLKTNPQAARDGVWVSYPANSDGSVPRFQVRRATFDNPDYKRVNDAVTKQFRRENVGDLSQATARKMLTTIFVKSLLVTWENVQPDDDGNELPFSEEAALDLFNAPEWSDLWDELNFATNNAALFRAEERDKNVKN